MASYAKGNAAAWLGQALMDMASRKRDEKARSAMMAEERDWRQQMFDAQQGAADRAFNYGVERDRATDTRLAQEREDRLSQMGQQRIDAGFIPDEAMLTPRPSVGGVGFTGDAAKLMGEPSPSGVGRALMDFVAPPKLESRAATSDVTFSRGGGFDPTRSVAYKQAEATAGLQQRLQSEERARQVGALRGAVDPTRLRIFEATGQLPAERAPTTPSFQSVVGGDGKMYSFDTRTGQYTPTDVTAPQRGVTKSDPVAAGFARRMEMATQEIESLAPKGTDMSQWDEGGARATGLTNAAGAVPFLGSRFQTAAMSGTQERYRAAQEAWVRAKLRKESGAAIGKKEMEDEIKTYFPQPGESDEVVQYKRKLRELENQNMKQAAGAALGPNPQAGGLNVDSLIDELRQAGMIQ